MNWLKSSTNTIDTYISNTFYNGVTNTCGINMRQEVNKILNNTFCGMGHYIVYRRYNRCQVSTTFNKQTREGVDGPAYEYRDEVYTTRKVPIGLKGRDLGIVKAGSLIEDEFIYYFEYFVCPKIGDNIFELNLGTEEQTSPPNPATVEMLERYTIQAVHPYRMHKGRVEYWSVSCKFDEVKY